MAEPVTIARPYAEAAFKLAREQNALAAWADAISLIDDVIQDPQIQTLIGSPDITGPALEALLLGVVGDRIPGEARNFVQVLVMNRRLDVMPFIRQLFEELKREQEGVLEATVISAHKMTDVQVKGLVDALAARHGRKINATVETDPELIGGVRIVMGDKVIDASVRGRLEAMAVALTH